MDRKTVTVTGTWMYQIYLMVRKVGGARELMKE